MKLMMRGNKQLWISDSQQEAMEKQGYVEIDEKTGKPVKTIPGDADLKKENAALQKENKRLETKVKELESEIQALKAEKP